MNTLRNPTAVVHHTIKQMQKKGTVFIIQGILLAACEVYTDYVGQACTNPKAETEMAIFFFTTVVINSICGEKGRLV